MNALEHLYLELQDNINSIELRSIIADWYEDANKPSYAAAIRWSIKNNLRPYKSLLTFSWFNAETVNVEEDTKSNLPSKVYLNLKGLEGVEGVYCSYACLREAYEDFCEGYNKTITEGWNPDSYNKSELTRFE